MSNGIPSDLACQIREHLRATHGSCDVAAAREDGCALAQLWAEDIQEILDLAREFTP